MRFVNTDKPPTVAARLLYRSLAILVLALISCGCYESRNQLRVDSPTRPTPATPSLKAADHAHNDVPSLHDTADLPAILAHAALNNPQLEAAFHRWAAALARVPQVTSLPDPRFTYRYFIQEIETRVGPQRQAFSLSQTFPWLGKLKNAGDISASQANMAQTDYTQTRLKLFHNVTDAYCDYYHLHRSVATVEKTTKLLADLQQVLNTRYQASTSTHSDVLRTQIEHDIFQRFL